MEDKQTYTTWLEVKQLTKRNKGNISIEDLNFSAAQFEKVAIAGETGSGKTSILKMIGGLEQAESGEVLFQGKRVKGPDEQLIPGHKKIAYLSQFFELRHNYYIHEILEYANQLEEAEAQKLYDICQINHLLNRKTNELSGGEAQRIALARLLSSAPELLLLDEPYSNLDGPHKRIMSDVIKNICSEMKITCMMVSHFADDILSWADTVVVIDAGKMVQKGKPHELYHQPINEYVATLFGECNILHDDILHIAAPELLGKKAMVRPEKIQLTANADSTLQGTVLHSAFHGNYYMTDVQIGNKLIEVQTAVAHNRNESVGVVIDAKDIWPIA